MGIPGWRASFSEYKTAMHYVGRLPSGGNVSEAGWSLRPTSLPSRGNVSEWQLPPIMPPTRWAGCPPGSQWCRVRGGWECTFLGTDENCRSCGDACKGAKTCQPVWISDDSPPYYRCDCPPGFIACGTPAEPDRCLPMANHCCGSTDPTAPKCPANSVCCCGDSTLSSTCPNYAVCCGLDCMHPGDTCCSHERLLMPDLGYPVSCPPPPKDSHLSGPFCSDHGHCCYCCDSHANLICN
jgi:hypothetical protein